MKRRSLIISLVAIVGHRRRRGHRHPGHGHQAAARPRPPGRRLGDAAAGGQGRAGRADRRHRHHPQPHRQPRAWPSPRSSARATPSSSTCPASRTRTGPSSSSARPARCASGPCWPRPRPRPWRPPRPARPRRSPARRRPALTPARPTVAAVDDRGHDDGEPAEHHRRGHARSGDDDHAGAGRWPRRSRPGEKDTPDDVRRPARAGAARRSTSSARPSPSVRHAISTAAAGVQNGQWVVDLKLKDGAKGLDAWNTWAAKCYSQEADCPTGGMAIVLDGTVIAAPVPQTAVLLRHQRAGLGRRQRLPEERGQGPGPRAQVRRPAGQARAPGGPDGVGHAGQGLAARRPRSPASSASSSCCSS